MTTIEKALMAATQKAADAEQHDLAVRYTLMLNGIDPDSIIPQSGYIYAAECGIRPDELWFRVTSYDDNGEPVYEEILVDLESGLFQTRTDELGYWWTDPMYVNSIAEEECEKCPLWYGGKCHNTCTSESLSPCPKDNP